jgi:hypothetical protein
MPWTATSADLEKCRRRVQRPRRRRCAQSAKRCHSSRPTESASQRVSQVQAKGRTSSGDGRRTLTANQTAVIANETPSGPGRGRKADHGTVCRRRANATLEANLPAAFGCLRPAPSADGCKLGRGRAANGRPRRPTAMESRTFTPGRSTRKDVKDIVRGAAGRAAGRSSQPDHRKGRVGRFDARARLDLYLLPEHIDFHGSQE